MKELISIQYLRGVAALLVVIFHISRIPSLRYLSWLDTGAIGVQIFFVISGFIMWYTTSSRRLSPFEFWYHRIIRVVPLYWLFLLLVIVISLSNPQDLNSTALTTAGIIKSFLFIPYYNAVPINGIAPILVPGWSLNYEMFFYLLFGFSLFLSARRLQFLFLGLTLATLVVLGQVFRFEAAAAVVYTNSAILLFLEGILLAAAYNAFHFSGARWGAPLTGISAAWAALGTNTGTIGRAASLLGLHIYWL
jgi:exopolysaccharide production protein ExoZ